MPVLRYCGLQRLAAARASASLLRMPVLRCCACQRLTAAYVMLRYWELQRLAAAPCQCLAAASCQCPAAAPCQRLTVAYAIASLQLVPVLRYCVCRCLAVTHGHHSSRYCSWQQCSAVRRQLEEGRLDRSTLLEQLLH